MSLKTRCFSSLYTVSLTLAVGLCGCGSNGNGAGTTMGTPGGDGGDPGMTMGMPDLGPAIDLAPPPIGPSGDFEQLPNVDGVDRRYLLTVPDSAVEAMKSGPVPLLIALHGAGDNADNFNAALRLFQTAAKHAFVLAVPDGYGNVWYSQSWPGDDGQQTGLQNDVHLMQQIIAETSAAYYIDPKRIYVCGHSRGAGMTGLLAMFSGNAVAFDGKYKSPFAAYAINAGFFAFGGEIDLAESAPKRPLWIIHGDGDRVVTYGQGEQLADAFMSAGWPVTFTGVPGAGHTWLFRSQYGQTNDDLWDFFAKNPLP